MQKNTPVYKHNTLNKSSGVLGPDSRLGTLSFRAFKGLKDWIRFLGYFKGAKIWDKYVIELKSPQGPWLLEGIFSNILNFCLNLVKSSEKHPGSTLTWQVWGRSFRDFLKEWLSLEGRPRTCPHSPGRMALTQGQLQIYPSRLSCAPESPISAVSPLDFLIHPKHESKYLGVIPRSSFTCKFYVLRLRGWPGSASLTSLSASISAPLQSIRKREDRGSW